MKQADNVIVLDFETTGLSPEQGDRAIEIGAVKIQNGIVIDRFQSLMNPGRRISPFIVSYTGITNGMLRTAKPCAEVMEQFAEFMEDYNLVAHNASFDKRFLDAEFANIGKAYTGQFSCSMLISRRIYQDAPSHKLSSLVSYTQISSEGVFHRALYDAEMTAKLWLVMLADIQETYALPTTIPFVLIQQLAKTPKHKVRELFNKINPQ